jgi:hypothetical protein
MSWIPERLTKSGQTPMEILLWAPAASRRKSVLSFVAVLSPVEPADHEKKEMIRKRNNSN